MRIKELLLNEKLDCLLFNIFIIFNSIFCIGLFKFGVTPTIVKANYVLIPLVFILRFRFVQSKVLDLLLLSVWIIVNYYFKESNKTLAYGLLVYSTYLITLKTYRMKKSLVYFTIISVLGGLIAQLAQFRFKEFYTLAEIDPNFSALQFYYLIIMLTPILGTYVTFPLNYFPIMLKSRSYLLSIFVFYVFNFKRVKKWITKFNFPVWGLWFASLLLVLLIGETFLYLKNQFEIKQEYGFSFAKFLNVFDESNRKRFLTNRYFIEYIFEFKNSVLGFKDYLEMSHYFMKHNFRIVPHNSTFKVIGIHGLLSIIYFYFTFKVLKYVKDYALLISLFVYSMFLMRSFDHYYLIMFVCAYTISKEGKKEEA